MTKNEVFRQIKKIIMEKFNLEEDDVKLTSTFVEDVGADSLDLVDLVMALEDEFGIKVDEEDTESLRSIEDVVDYIYEKLGGTAEDEDIMDDVEAREDDLDADDMDDDED